MRCRGDQGVERLAPSLGGRQEHDQAEAGGQAVGLAFEGSSEGSLGRGQPLAAHQLLAPIGQVAGGRLVVTSDGLFQFGGAFSEMGQQPSEPQVGVKRPLRFEGIQQLAGGGGLPSQIEKTVQVDQRLDGMGIIEATVEGQGGEGHRGRGGMAASQPGFSLQKVGREGFRGAGGGGGGRGGTQGQGSREVLFEKSDATFQPSQAGSGRMAEPEEGAHLAGLGIAFGAGQAPGQGQAQIEVGGGRRRQPTIDGPRPGVVARGGQRIGPATFQGKGGRAVGLALQGPLVRLAEIDEPPLGQADIAPQGQIGRTGRRPGGQGLDRGFGRSRIGGSQVLPPQFAPDLGIPGVVEQGGFQGGDGPAGLVPPAADQGELASQPAALGRTALFRESQSGVIQQR